MDTTPFHRARTRAPDSLRLRAAVAGRGECRRASGTRIYPCRCRERGIGTDRFEFQMRYGIRRDLQRRLAGEGYRVRVYVPYGTAWYPYFMRRLAERPANA